MILFLPAAGAHRQPDYYGEGSWVVMSTCGMPVYYTLWTPGAKAYSGQAYNTSWGAKSVRLATVVSGLTVEMSSVPACCGDVRRS